jgi:hypothetical protein
MAFDQSEHSNGLLKYMRPEALESIAPYLEWTDLPVATPLVEANKPIEYAYFLSSGIAAQVCSAHGRLEIGICGNEGLSGFAVVLGTLQAPHATFMHIAGAGVRIRTRDLQSAMRGCEALNAFLLTYIHIVLVQMSETARSAGRFDLKSRTARWLLMCHDRIVDDDMPFTHDFLSDMLGVRRAGITEAIHMLEGLGGIVAKRGFISIRDRRCLERAAGDSYGVPEAEYRRLIVEPHIRSALRCAQPVPDADVSMLIG